MAIERFVWTSHASLRLQQRHLTQAEIELAIRVGHGERRPNDGHADWLIEGLTTYGTRFAAIYDHPANGDERAARIISAWRLS